MEGIQDGEAEPERRGDAVGEFGPELFFVGLDRGIVLGEGEAEAAVGIDVAVGDVVDELANGPAAVAIGRGELLVGEAAERLAEFERRVLDHFDGGGALIGIQWTGEDELADGIARVRHKLGLLAVDEESGDVVKEVAEGLFGFQGESGFGEGVVHERDPSIAGFGINGEWAVAHAETGMAALFDVGLRTAEAEDEELTKAGFGAVEIIPWVHGADDVVSGDLAIEGVDEAAEAFVADGIVNLVVGEGEGHDIIID